MNATLAFIHWLAGVVVLAEALNTLQRTAPHALGLIPRQRLVETLKAIAWLLLAGGAGGAVARPLISLPVPGVDQVCLLLGFAVLIVRTRVKEG